MKLPPASKRGRPLFEAIWYYVPTFYVNTVKEKKMNENESMKPSKGNDKKNEWNDKNKQTNKWYKMTKTKSHGSHALLLVRLKNGAYSQSLCSNVEPPLVKNRPSQAFTQSGTQWDLLLGEKKFPCKNIFIQFSLYDFYVRILFMKILDKEKSELR